MKFTGTVIYLKENKTGMSILEPRLYINKDTIYVLTGLSNPNELEKFDNVKIELDGDIVKGTRILNVSSVKKYL